jgi:GT2 family glycosyltransferase
VESTRLMAFEIAPQVSIVVPSHDRPQLLAEAMASLLAQEFSSWEAIVVDDASTPPVKLVVQDDRFRVIRHGVSLGGAAAKNTGIRHASGDILAFLDDDDRLAPAYLSQAVAVLRQHPELDVVFMGCTWFGLNAKSGQRNYDLAMESFLQAASGQRAGNIVLFDAGLVTALLKSVPMALQRPVVRRSAMHRIGLYRPSCLLWDCDWSLRAAIHAHTALLPAGLYEQRADRQGYSSQQRRLIEHMQSAVEMKDRLRMQCRRGEHPKHAVAIRGAAADANFNLAWHLYQDGQRQPAFKALGRSAWRKPGTRQAKLLLRLLLPMGCAKPARQTDAA